MSEIVRELDTLLQRLQLTVPAIRQVVVVSSDGLPLASATGMTQDDADRLAAVASGMIGLAYGSAGRFGAGAVSNVIVQMEKGWMFVTGIRGGSLVCCLTDKDVDMAEVAFEMSIFVQRVGESLTPEAREQLMARLVGSR